MNGRESQGDIAGGRKRQGETGRGRDQQRERCKQTGRYREKRVRIERKDKERNSSGGPRETQT